MEFKNPEQEIWRFRRRIGFVGGLVLACFGLLLLRFAWLQVIQHDYYKTRAEDNRISLVPITPNRGLIVDRNDVLLARNYSGYTIEIAPSKVANLEQTIDELSTVISIEARDRKHFKKLREENRNFESVPIRTRVSDEEAARFIANRYRFPGVDIQARLFRQYPFGAFASHLLGYIGRINDKDLDKIKEQEQESNYRGTDHFGKAGLEHQYEFELHGTSGVEQVEVDVSGHPVRTLARTPPISGNNLTLTIDARLQQIAEKAFGTRKGALVAIEPSTGGVLALVSVPNFDPNLFVDGIDTANWDLLNNSPDKPMLNRALNGTYPPGSTFKPFMALAALEYGKRKPEQAIQDPGFFVFGGHTFRDDKKGGHGSVNMYESIVESCDTYYYMLASDMGIDKIANFMRQFGFGQKSGIDIGGESTGVLPSQEWKHNHFKRPEQQRWYAGETISIGIGQGYNAYTPIQLAQAVATLANNGVMFRPHLVKSITDTRSGHITELEPKPVRTIDLKPENIKFIKDAMIGVNKEGTGALAFAGAEYVSAGKTGTAQLYSLRGEKYTKDDVKDHLRDHALFIAFAPADNPKIALAVLVENGGFGAQAAAPIARQIFDYYLLGKVPAEPAPEDSEGAPQ
ncbi:MAG: penicillin-binding protein 2 [Georgfuchsia sp.]